MNWIEKLKPGDKVILYKWGYGSNAYYLTEVEKITPKGYVKVDGYLFCNDGSCRGGYALIILDPSDPNNQRKLEEFREKCYVKRVLDKLRELCSDDISYEQAKCFDVLINSNNPPTLEQLKNIKTCEKAKQLTNADKIRSMTDEALGKWVCSIMSSDCCKWTCPARNMCGLSDNGLVKWLKQPAKED